MKTYANNKLDSFYELDDNNITIKEYKLKNMKGIIGKSEVDKTFFFIFKPNFYYAIK
jgi:hypothetical protein